MLLVFLACVLPGTPKDTGDTDDTADSGDSGAPTLPPLAACVVPAGADPADHLADTEDAEIVGTITAAGTGAPPTGCQAREVWAAGAQRDLDVALAVWLVVTDGDGVAWEVSVTSGQFPDPTTLVGDDAEVGWHSVFASPFAGVSAETSVSLVTPQFAGWVGQAGSVEALDPIEPLTLGMGGVEAAWSDECLDYSLHTLTGTDADGTRRDATTGTSTGFGGVALWSGGVVVGADPRCSEVDGGYAGAVTWSFP